MIFDMILYGDNYMKKYNIEYIDCPICNCSEYDIYINRAKELYIGLNEYFNVVKCKSCGHIYTNPRPTKDTIRYFYPDNAGYYLPSSSLFENSHGLRKKIKKIIFQLILEKYYNYNLPLVYYLCQLSFLGSLLALQSYIFFNQKIELSYIPKYVDNGRLLEIGCSYGLYLKKMSEIGWNVYGIDFNEKAVDFAKKQLGLNNVLCGDIEVVKFEKNFFDVVTMNMVLEHLYSPNEFLQQINKFMVINGQLIITVPDITGFEAKLYKRYFYGLQVPQHLHHFSPRIINNLLQSKGFKVNKIIHHNFDRDIVASANYLPIKILSYILHQKIIRFSLVRPFVNLLSCLGKTSRMTIYATKVKDV